MSVIFVNWKPCAANRRRAASETCFRRAALRGDAEAQHGDVELFNWPGVLMKLDRSAAFQLITRCE
jgi:hypothetical protein